MKTIVFRYMVFGMTRVCTITTDQLIDAIAVVESNRGATSENVYQLKPFYVRDVCRITHQTLTHEQATASDEIARWCIGAYWEHYVARFSCISGKRPTRRRSPGSTTAGRTAGGIRSRCLSCVVFFRP